MRRKLREDIRGYFDKDRFALIPAGDTVEATSIEIEGQIRVHWGGSKEGMGFVMVDKDELESSSDPELISGRQRSRADYRASPPMADSHHASSPSTCTSISSPG